MQRCETSGLQFVPLSSFYGETSFYSLKNSSNKSVNMGKKKKGKKKKAEDKFNSGCRVYGD